jgi:hypothetical protein
MGSLIAAYVGGWLAVAGYTAWLGIQNGRLARRLDELEALIDSRREQANRRTKAA